MADNSDVADQGGTAKRASAHGRSAKPSADGREPSPICPGCQVVRLVRISVQLRNRAVTMCSCSNCGTFWAADDGRPVALSGVLELASPSAG